MKYRVLAALLAAAFGTQLAIGEYLRLMRVSPERRPLQILLMVGTLLLGLMRCMNSKTKRLGFEVQRAFLLIASVSTFVFGVLRVITMRPDEEG